MQTIYTGEMKSYAGRLYTVKIENMTAGGNAAPQTLDFTEGGIEITRNETGDFDPLYSMGCKIEVWSDTNYRFVDLMTAPDRTYRMTVSDPSGVLFVGWITSELYEEEYTQPPYPVSITATDGLASLEDYELDIAALPRPVPGNPALVSVAHVIEHALRRTGLPLDIEWLSTIRAAENGPDGRAAYEAVYVDVAALDADEKAADILTDFLAAFSLRVYQQDGRWMIDRLPDRISSPAAVVSIDTSDCPFTDSPALSVYAARGAHRINLNVDRFDSLAPAVKLLPEYVIPRRDIELAALPRVWYHTEADALLDETAEYPLRVKYKTSRYIDLIVRVPFSRLRQGQKLTVSYKIKLDHERGGTDYRDYNIVKNDRITLRKGGRAVAFKGYNVPGHSPNYGMPGHQSGYNWSYDTPSLIPVDYVELWDGRLADQSKVDYYKFSNALYNGMSVSLSLDIEGSFLLEADEVVIEIPLYVDIVKMKREDYKLGAGKIRWTECCLSDVSIKIETAEAIPDCLTAKLAGGYVRDAEETALRLRTDDHIPIDESYKGALYDRSGRLLDHLYVGNHRAGIEQLMQEVCFAQFSEARDMLTGRISRHEMLKPSDVYVNPHRAGRRYTLNALTFNALAGEQDVVLKEIKNIQIESKWQK